MKKINNRQKYTKTKNKKIPQNKQRKRRGTVCGNTLKTGHHCTLIKTKQGTKIKGGEKIVK